MLLCLAFQYFMLVQPQGLCSPCFSHDCLECSFLSLLTSYPDSLRKTCWLDKIPADLIWFEIKGLCTTYLSYVPPTVAILVYLWFWIKSVLFPASHISVSSLRAGPVCLAHQCILSTWYRAWPVSYTLYI
jgi:hypothetical protein